MQLCLTCNIEINNIVQQIEYWENYPITQYSSMAKLCNANFHEKFRNAEKRITHLDFYLVKFTNSRKNSCTLLTIRRSSNTEEDPSVVRRRFA